MLNYWETLSKEKWEKVSYPYRPRKEDLSFLKQVEDNKKTILFGATPEVRIFFSERKIPITIFDYSKNSVEEMGKFVIDKTLETYIYGDWLEFPLEGKYDYIIGDLVYNIIDINKHKVLDRQITKVSKPGTKIFFRTLSRKDMLFTFLRTGNLVTLVLFLSSLNKVLSKNIFSRLSKLFFGVNKGTQVVFLK